MSLRNLAKYTVAALAGATLLASLNPASAFTLSGPSLEQPIVSAGIDTVQWHHWHHGWGGGWGWHRPWGWGGGPHCWRNYWGHLRCNY